MNQENSFWKRFIISKNNSFSDKIHTYFCDTFEIFGIIDIWFNLKSDRQSSSWIKIQSVQPSNQFDLTWDQGLSWILMSTNDLNTFGQITSPPLPSPLLHNRIFVYCPVSTDTWLACLYRSPLPPPPPPVIALFTRELSLVQDKQSTHVNDNR